MGEAKRRSEEAEAQLSKTLQQLSAVQADVQQRDAQVLQQSKELSALRRQAQDLTLDNMQALRAEQSARISEQQLSKRLLAEQASPPSFSPLSH